MPEMACLVCGQTNWTIKRSPCCHYDIVETPVVESETDPQTRLFPTRPSSNLVYWWNAYTDLSS